MAKVKVNNKEFNARFKNLALYFFGKIKGIEKMSEIEKRLAFLGKQDMSVEQLDDLGAFILACIRVGEKGNEENAESVSKLQIEDIVESFLENPDGFNPLFEEMQKEMPKEVKKPGKSKSKPTK